MGAFPLHTFYSGSVVLPAREFVKYSHNTLSLLHSLLIVSQPYKHTHTRTHTSLKSKSAEQSTESDGGGGRKMRGDVNGRGGGWSYVSFLT